MLLTRSGVRRFTHVDIELMRLRMLLTPGQRVQAMLDAREVLVGLIRGRLRPQYPNLSDREFNLKVLEEIERGQNVRPWTHALPGYSP